MSNTFQTNTFIQGMNLDIDITAMPESQYRYAENVRIITDKDGTSGVLLNIQSTREVRGGDFIGSNETVIASTTIDKYGIIFTVDNIGINRVYRVYDYDQPEVNNIIILKGDLGYKVTSNLKIVANYESDSIIKIYFTDGVQSIRSLNIMSDRYILNPSGTNITVDNAGNIKDPTLLDILPGTLLPAPQIVELGTSGNLVSGTVLYSYQLYNERGTNTDYAPCSNAVHLTTSNTTNTSNTYLGTGKDVTVNKSAIINIDISDILVGLFDKCRLVRIHYKDSTEQPTIDIIDEIDFPANSSMLIYKDTGNKPINTITVEEFGKYLGSDFTAATIEKKDNILFAADIKDSAWNPVYDARAYRFTEDNRLILNSSNASENISVVAGADINQIYESIPKDHDCINPFNLQDYELQDKKQCKFMFNRPTKLGGSGPNIEYEFIDTELKVDNQWGYPTVSTTSSIIDSLPVRDYGGGPIGNINIPSYNRLNNYNDPYISSKFKGYQRDEIYRFGIVFYNSKNISSPVFWIGDIKMPHSREMDPWYFDVKNQDSAEFYANPLGIKFNIKNFPDGAVAYEIVRCKRTKDDRTVLMQGILSDVTSFPYRSTTVGDWVKNDNDIRPRIPLGICDTNVRMLTQGVTGQFDRLLLLVNKVTKTEYVFISPELDITGDSLISDMKGCYFDVLMWADTRMKNSSVSILNFPPFTTYKYFCTPAKSVYASTASRVDQPGFIGSTLGESDSNYIYIAYNLTSGNDEEMVTNIISKRYLMHYTNLLNRVKINIKDVMSPPIMKKGELTNSSSFYRSINGKLYINYGVSWNDREQLDWLTAKVGYFGRCAVISTDSSVPRMSNTQFNLRTMSTYLRSMLNEHNYTPFGTPVVNVKRNIVPYGGNNYNARNNSVYISTYSYKKIDSTTSDTLYVFGGDTYMGVHDHRTSTPVADNTGGAANGRRTLASMSDFIPVETTINLGLQYGESTSRTTDMIFTNPYLADTIEGGNLGYASQTRDYYAYNDAYSVQPDAKMYVEDSTTSIQDLRLPNKIMYSETKTSNEITDSWTLFKPANYIEVDSQYGPVTNMKTFKDRLFFWLDSALGIASVNDRSLISDNNVGALTLGTGGVLTRYDYSSTNNGSSISNDDSIVASDNALYWYDTDKNELCTFTDGVHKLSKEKNVQTYLNNNSNTSVHLALYDNKFDEILMCFESSVLVYNETTLLFTSFYTFNPDASLKFSDKLLYILNNKLMENADFPLNKMQSRILFIVNKDPLYTKTFDNVFFSGKFTSIGDMLTKVVFSTKNQQGTIELNYLDGGNAIDYREDTYRFAIGRENASRDDLSYPGRLKGKYLICDYTINCDNQHNFNIPNINTSYRYSLV